MLIPNSIQYYFNKPQNVSKIILNQIESGFYDKFIPHIKDSVVIDCGGNIGLFSLYAYLKGASKIVAVEPTSEHINIFKEFIKAYNCDNIILEEAAIYSENTILDFYTNPNNTSMNSLHQYGYGSNMAYKVNALTLESLIQKHNLNEIGFLKIDIEGSETHLFDSDSFFETLNKVNCFFIEVHDLVGIGNLENLKRIQEDWITKIKKLCPNFSIIETIGPDGVWGKK